MGLPGISSLGNLFSAVGSTALNLGSSVLGYMSDAKNRAAQLDMMREQNAWQSAENDKSRKWQSDEWTRQWRLENLYNTPSAQVQRLLEAGINPAALLASSGSAPLGVPSASPSTPSGTTVTPQQVTGFSYANSAQFGSTIAQLLEAASRVADSNLNPIAKQEVQSRVTRNLSEADKANEEANLIAIRADIESTFGKKEAAERINKLVADAQLAAASTDKEKALKAWYDVLTEVKKYEQEFFNKPSYPLLLKKIQKEIENYSASTAELGARAAMHRSSAQLSDSQRQTIDDLRKGQITALDLSNRIKDVAAQVTESTKQEQIHQIMEAAEQAGLITQETAKRVEILSAEASWADSRQMIGAFGDLLGSFAGAKNAQINQFSAEQKADFNQKYLNYLNSEKWTETEVVRTKNGTYTTTYQRNQ